MKRWPGLPSDATHLLGSAATAGPIPDDYPAALWWRILKDGSFELLSGICQVRGFDISVRDGSARRSRQPSGDASDLRNHDVPQGGTPGGGTKAVMPPPHH